MIYIDTNIFIYAIENHPKYGSACKKILLDIESEKVKAGASILVPVSYTHFSSGRNNKRPYKNK